MATDTTPTSATTPVPTQGSNNPRASAARARPPRLRRRGLFVGGLTLVALAGVAGTALWNSTTDTHAVLALSESVMRGEEITEESLTVANITLDSSLDPISVDDLDQVVGQHAASDVPAGTILTQGALTSELVPGSGEELVGLAVTPNQFPVERLLAGDTVRVVDTPREQDDPPEGEPSSTTATVVSVGPLDQTGRRVVDVIVEEGEGPQLAARAATGRIAIVLQSRQN